jgi:hypothetical protein
LGIDYPDRIFAHKIANSSERFHVELAAERHRNALCWRIAKHIIKQRFALASDEDRMPSPGQPIGEVECRLRRAGERSLACRKKYIHLAFVN